MASKEIAKSAGSPADQPANGRAMQEKGRRKRRRTVVPHEELVPGTAPTARLKGRTFSASVVLGAEDSPEVEFDGARYPSLSAAGKAAAGYPVNGWRFWKTAERDQQ